MPGRSAGGRTAGQRVGLRLRSFPEAALLAGGRKVLPALRAGPLQGERAVPQAPHERQPAGVHRLGRNGHLKWIQVNNVSSHLTHIQFTVTLPDNKPLPF